MALSQQQLEGIYIDILAEIEKEHVNFNDIVKKIEKIDVEGRGQLLKSAYQEGNRSFRLLNYALSVKSIEILQALMSGISDDDFIKVVDEDMRRATLSYVDDSNIDRSSKLIGLLIDRGVRFSDDDLKIITNNDHRTKIEKFIKEKEKGVVANKIARVEFPPYKTTPEDQANKLVGLVLKKLTPEQQVQLGRYAEVKIRVRKEALKKEREDVERKITNPFVVVPVRGAGRAQNMEDLTSTIKKHTKADFCLLRNSSKSSNDDGTHWDFNVIDGGVRTERKARGNGACGFYALIGIIASNNQFQTKIVEDLLKKAGIDISKVKKEITDGKTVGDDEVTLSEKMAREFVASAIEKKFASTSQKPRGYDKRIADIRKIGGSWLADEDITDCFEALGINLINAKAFFEMEAVAQDQDNVIRNVIRNLIGKAGNSEDEARKGFDSEMKDLKKYSFEQIAKDVDEARQKAATKSPSSIIAPKSAFTAEELRKLNADVKNLIIGKIDNIDSAVVEAYKKDIKDQEKVSNPKSPYCGLGLAVKIIDDKECGKVFEVAQDFIKGRKFTIKDSSEETGLEGKCILNVTKNGVKTKIDPSNSGAIISIFHQAGDIEFEIFDPKDRKVKTITHNILESDIYVTTNCKFAKQGLKGELGAKYDPEKHGVSEAIIEAKIAVQKSPGKSPPNLH